MQILKPHVSLNVSNVDAAVAFYEKAFGISRKPEAPAPGCCAPKTTNVR